MRTFALALVPAVAASSGGCGTSAPRETPIEAKLRAAISAAIAVGVDRVRCATPERCVAVVGTVELPVRVTAAGADEWKWELDGLVLRAADLEAAIATELRALDVQLRPACGARVRIVQPAERVTCSLDGSPGKVWARIAADGTADLEVALGAAVVSARTGDVAETELEALSRALDRDDPTAEDDESGKDARP